MRKETVYFILYQVATFIAGVAISLGMFSICVKSGSIFDLFTNSQGVMVLFVGGVFGWLFFGGAKTLCEVKS